MLEQLDAIKILAEAAHKSGALVVSEIGSQTTWLYEAFDDPAHLYLSGPMGMAPSVALGVAAANPDRPVLAICGDGALAMNFSALVTAAHVAPENLTLAVMDNGVYDYTGQVPSPSTAIDWEKMIAGLPAFKSFEMLGEKTNIALKKDGGLCFIHCRVKNASRKAVKFPFKAPEIHKRFKTHLQD